MLPDAPTERLMMAWAVLGDEIWVAGGMRHGETLPTVESYNTKTGTWQERPPLPVPLHHATATAYRGEMVIIGGASDTLSDASNKVFAFRNGKWEELPPLQHARAAAGGRGRRRQARRRRRAGRQAARQADGGVRRGVVDAGRRHANAP